jgi:hypothetical protein
MKVSGIVIEDTKTLVPNKEHKNFTESDTIVPKGTKVDGRATQGRKIHLSCIRNQRWTNHFSK